MNADEFIATGFSLSKQRGKGLITGRILYSEEFMSFSSASQSVWEIGFMYGRFAKNKNGMASLSAGMSLVGGSIYPKPGNRRHLKDFTTVGIPVQCQLFVTPTRVFGFGLVGFGNLNLERSIFGGMFCIQLGRLK